MKTLASVILSILVLTSSAVAQDEPAEVRVSKSRGTKVGIGLAIAPAGTFLVTDDDGLMTFIPVLLRVPVNISMFKLEPEVGLFSVSTKNELVGTDQFSENTGTLLRIGAGLFYNAPISSDASVYVGPKIGIMRISSQRKTRSSSSLENVERTTDVSQSNLFMSLLVGGEYFFSSHFSIGAEAGFEYISKGDEESNSTPQDPLPTQETSTTGSEIHTKSALTARFYI